MAADQVDVAVIGAGPAGLACATRLAQAGLSVVLLDEQEAVGGQIYRAIERSDAQRRAAWAPAMPLPSPATKMPLTSSSPHASVCGVKHNCASSQRCDARNDQVNCVFGTTP